MGGGEATSRRKSVISSSLLGKCHHEASIYFKNHVTHIVKDRDVHSSKHHIQLWDYQLLIKFVINLTKVVMHVHVHGKATIHACVVSCTFDTRMIIIIARELGVVRECAEMKPHDLVFSCRRVRMSSGYSRFRGEGVLESA